MRALLSLAIYLLPILPGVISASTFAYSLETAETQSPSTLREQDIKPRAALNVPDSVLASKAQTYIRVLPKKILPAGYSDTLSTDGDKQNPEDTGKQGYIQKLEEIRILDRIEPEDYVAPKPPPMLAFRAKLDQLRPVTPKEITLGAICFISGGQLCYVDPNVELRIDDRNEARAKNPPSFAGQP